MNFSNVLKWLVITSIFGVLAAGVMGAVLVTLVFPYNVTIYLKPFQVEFSSSEQSYVYSLATRTRTAFQPGPSLTTTLQPTFTITSTPTTTATETAAPTNTPTFTPTPTFTETFTPTPIPTEVSPTSSPTEVAQPAIPDQAAISNIIGHRQIYTLDCESRSAVDMAAYFGVNIDENDFLNQLPRSDDPDEGFVGSFTDYRGQIPPNSYGVHADPIASILRAYGLNATAQHGFSYDNLRMEIAAGRPVEVWVIGNTVGGYASSYTASNGHTSLVAPYEHTVLVIGYDPNYITILDEATVYTRTVNGFLNSWSVLGFMAVTISQ